MVRGYLAALRVSDDFTDMIVVQSVARRYLADILIVQSVVRRWRACRFVPTDGNQGLDGTIGLQAVHRGAQHPENLEGISMLHRFYLLQERLQSQHGAYILLGTHKHCTERRSPIRTRKRIQNRVGIIAGVIPNRHLGGSGGRRDRQTIGEDSCFGMEHIKDE